MKYADQVAVPHTALTAAGGVTVSEQVAVALNCAQVHDLVQGVAELIVPVFDVHLAQYGVGMVMFCTYDCQLAVPHAGVSLD